MERLGQLGLVERLSGDTVVETVEEEYVPHIQPPVQPLSWAEVCGSEEFYGVI